MSQNDKTKKEEELINLQTELDRKGQIIQRKNKQIKALFADAKLFQDELKKALPQGRFWRGVYHWIMGLDKLGTRRK